ncbi:related to CYTOCHROME B561 [Cephalotrichum gorgonifer]|uniref:Related to CYTOCHROME B561 n=1 Tax=Cephalotrichum gorgonifer TaxID=2041049 RepID=A0AAE8N307_9PEZI|nr:related to CYTOCHROME B561 [Cephalotrichum gorgonifer]
MTSTTEPPTETSPERVERQGEMEPLLGRPGDASQAEGASIANNLYLGTAFIAQIGVVIAFVLVWTTVLTNDIILFSGHPLAQSIGVVAIIQSILILQPTHTAAQKRVGQRLHAGLHLVSFLALVTGVAIIEYNKVSNGLAHFHSPHAYIGVATCAVLAVQYLVGFTMWATPALYGGEDRAKAVWKYHRVSGYLIFLLLVASLLSGAKTDFVANVLGMQFWVMVVASVLILIGVLPRIKKQKFGFKH